MQEKVINGDAATCLPKLPYSGLSRFGSSFLSKLLGLGDVCEFQLGVEAENIWDTAIHQNILAKPRWSKKAASELWMCLLVRDAWCR